MALFFNDFSKKLQIFGFSLETHEKNKYNIVITKKKDGQKMALEARGRVIASEGGLYLIYTDSGERISCKPRGRFRYEKMRLLVGDIVTLGRDDGGNYVIDDIGARKNALLRPPMANLDTMYIVTAAASPTPIFLNIDKLTSIAEQNKISVSIVVTKSDLNADMAEELATTYGKAGYKVYVTGLDETEAADCLRSDMIREEKGKISTLAGASGVGKSTLLNRLFPTLKRQTGEVSRKIGRGRHTTRSVNLFPTAELCGEGEGFFADTPGFSMLDFENYDFFDVEALPFNFPEFLPYLGHCKYTKCTHCKEEGCLILEEVQKGNIAKTRHKSYCLLYDQLKKKHKWD